MYSCDAIGSNIVHLRGKIHRDNPEGKSQHYKTVRMVRSAKLILAIRTVSIYTLIEVTDGESSGCESRSCFRLPFSPLILSCQMRLRGAVSCLRLTCLLPCHKN